MEIILSFKSDFINDKISFGSLILNVDFQNIQKLVAYSFLTVKIQRNTVLSYIKILLNQQQSLI